METRTATFAAGCFWGVEETFRRAPGVVGTRVGYTGGALPNPDYRTVCNGDTGHAEAVEVKYDPAGIGYADLLEIFFANHNPTTLNRQGPDIGSQYRSAVFYHDEAQKAEALAYKDNLQGSGKYRRPIVTEVTPASVFYPAEEYHQRYLAKRGLDGCHL
jgi:peptide-methionine (S)-S-oxide reductase